MHMHDFFTSDKVEECQSMKTNSLHVQCMLKSTIYYQYVRRRKCINKCYILCYKITAHHNFFSEGQGEGVQCEHLSHERDQRKLPKRNRRVQLTQTNLAPIEYRKG